MVPPARPDMHHPGGGGDCLRNSVRMTLIGNSRLGCWFIVVGCIAEAGLTTTDFHLWRRCLVMMMLNELFDLLTHA